MTTIGAAVNVSPRSISPTRVRHTSCPVSTVHGDDRGVEQAVNDLAVRVRRATVDDVAAGDADGARIGMRLVDPFHGAARLGQIDGDEIVRERRDDVHRVVEHERLSFVALRHAGRERRHHVEVHDVGGLDRVEGAVAQVAVVAGRHPPLARGNVRHEPHGGRRAGHAALRSTAPPPVRRWLRRQPAIRRRGNGNDDHSGAVVSVHRGSVSAFTQAAPDDNGFCRSDSRNQAANSTSPPAGEDQSSRDPHQQSGELLIFERRQAAPEAGEYGAYQTRGENVSSAPSTPPWTAVAKT